jgi:hypothetical protein
MMRLAELFWQLVYDQRGSYYGTSLCRMFEPVNAREISDFKRCGCTTAEGLKLTCIDPSCDLDR